MSLASIPSAIGAEYLASKNQNVDRTFFQKIIYILTNITVEPFVLLVMLPSVMNSLTTQNLNLEKACRVNLQYNASICDAMVTRNSSGYEPFQEAEVQKLVSKMIGIKMVVVGSYPAILMLFLGSWSDRHSRRKPLILMPVIGDLIGSIFLFFCAHFFLNLSIEYSMLAETIPYALGGTWACCFLGLYTYVSSLCNDSDRTIRIGTVTMCQTISITVGIFFSGIMINLIGFKGVYSLSVCLMSLALFYGVFIIKEKMVVDEDKLEKGSGIKGFLALKHIKNTFKICFKEGKNNRRGKIIVIMFLSAMIMGPLHGEMAVFYLYTRIKCGWNEVDFSIYNSLHSVIQICGGIFALSLFSKYMKIGDAALGMIAMTSKIAACLVFAFAPSGIYFYLGAFVEVFHSTCHIALRSLMAKIVPPHELGQSNSVFGVFEAVTPLIFGPLYSTIYNTTIKSFPGAFYILTSVLYMITFYLFFWMHQANRKDEIENNLQDQVEQKKKLLEIKTMVIEKPMKE